MTSLAAFLAGYLHQDWDREYSDPSAASKEFALTEPLELVVRALGELAMLNAAALDEGAVEGVLGEAGCYYRPVDTSARAWLVDLEREIGAALWSRRS